MFLCDANLFLWSSMWHLEYHNQATWESGVASMMQNSKFCFLNSLFAVLIVSVCMAEETLRPWFVMVHKLKKKERSVCMTDKGRILSFIWQPFHAVIIIISCNESYYWTRRRKWGWAIFFLLELLLNNCTGACISVNAVCGFACMKHECEGRISLCKWAHHFQLARETYTRG